MYVSELFFFVLVDYIVTTVVHFFNYFILIKISFYEGCREWL